MTTTDITGTKICIKCGQQKPLSAFRNRERKDGTLGYWKKCKTCTDKQEAEQVRKKKRTDPAYRQQCNQRNKAWREQLTPEQKDQMRDKKRDQNAQRRVSCRDLDGWQMVHHRVRKQKREVQRYSHIRANPGRAEALRERNRRAHKRRMEVIRNDPNLLEAYHQKQREKNLRKKLRQQSTLIPDTIQPPDSDIEIKKGSKTQKSTIAAWLGGINK